MRSRPLDSSVPTRFVPGILSKSASRRSASPLQSTRFTRTANSQSGSVPPDDPGREVKGLAGQRQRSTVEKQRKPLVSDEGRSWSIASSTRGFSCLSGDTPPRHQTVTNPSHPGRKRLSDGKGTGPSVSRQLPVRSVYSIWIICQSANGIVEKLSGRPVTGGRTARAVDFGARLSRE